MATNPNDLIAGAIKKRTKEDLKNLDKGGNFAKIETSGVYEFKITMAKQIDSKKSDAKNFVIEMENKDGAKVSWKAGWYLNGEGSPLNKEGEIGISADQMLSMHMAVTGDEILPELDEATIKETEWVDSKPKEVTNKRMIAKDLIGKFVLAQVVRVRTNRVKREEVDGEWIETKLNEPREYNEVRRFFNADSEKTRSEILNDQDATAIGKSEEYCAKHPILDKFEPVPDAAAASSAAGPSSSSRGSTASSGGSTATRGFGRR